MWDVNENIVESKEAWDTEDNESTHDEMHEITGSQRGVCCNVPGVVKCRVFSPDRCKASGIVTKMAYEKFNEFSEEKQLMPENIINFDYKDGENKICLLYKE